MVNIWDIIISSIGVSEDSCQWKMVPSNEHMPVKEQKRPKLSFFETSE